MDFVERWKKSSKEASEAHYALRFDERELNDIRRGFLNDSAKQKILARYNSLKKRNTFLWIGCGIPFLLVGLIGISLLGFVFIRALWQNSSNPIAWIFVGFFVLVVTLMLGLGIYVLVIWLRRRNSTANDFLTNKVGISRGKVFIKISRTENSFNISYWMNGVEYILFDDAIGWEIHTHFFGGPNITGQTDRETKEDYIFYFLPESKRLLHFELA
ncbi:MAG: hypothetical protein K1X72_07425 [Pyrinomonadaceae bacterium]|nr:hypothetical protein [Pyrinomonadaceae bacterium]